MNDRKLESFFAAEDFKKLENYREGLSDMDVAAREANRILRKYFESCPVVYGDGPNMDILKHTKKPCNTHTARLCFVEEIKRECVEHEPDKRIDGAIDYSSGRHSLTLASEAHCKHCGIKLKARWEKAE